MNEKISRKIEQTFFVLINFLFSASPIIAGIFLVLSMTISAFICNNYSDFPDADEYYIKRALLAFWLIYMFLKLFLLPILYSFPKNFPFIHSFLEKFKNELKFKLKVLGSTMFIDILIYLVNVLLLCFISGKFEFDTHHFLLVGFFWLIFGFGASTSYLMFFLLKKIR